MQIPCSVPERPKHPDFLDLCIAMTGRAPLAGVYLDAPRQARRILDVELPEAIDDAFWPLIGWLAGKAAPDRIPLLRGLARRNPRRKTSRLSARPLAPPLPRPCCTSKA